MTYITFINLLFKQDKSSFPLGHSPVNSGQQLAHSHSRTTVKQTQMLRYLCENQLIYWNTRVISFPEYVYFYTIITLCNSIKTQSKFLPRVCMNCSLLTPLVPHYVKAQYLHFKFHANYFLLPWKIPEEISRWSMLFHY